MTRVIIVPNFGYCNNYPYTSFHCKEQCNKCKQLVKNARKKNKKIRIKQIRNGELTGLEDHEIKGDK